eukprot:CAMPEP_0177455748 /NCGR_PEP_ID=MMETSP0369-20130122/12079_1 /TAXON_ID=447022 ORGANISM="Scrippsiella hangoei-like, Strain SHHI-4" /NCGR_SAMPLE_ID=MMETSP0369 /ASSEMBLY_ACC=CAM_ASM_000364 /LENGTH=106 /DNA_ID=CAMNT_0018928653 /DNA_START=97 /DNA_END=415 /DNA_ORIENTATION=-
MTYRGDLQSSTGMQPWRNSPGKTMYDSAGASRGDLPEAPQATCRSACPQLDPAPRSAPQRRTDTAQRHMQPEETAVLQRGVVVEVRAEAGRLVLAPPLDAGEVVRA